MIDIENKNTGDKVEEEEECLFNDVYHDKGQECWPDHIGTSIILDDVSRLNACKVYSLNQVRTIEDVQRVLKSANENDQVVSIRGTKHSMGGHTLNRDGVVIDMKYITHMKYHNEERQVTVGTGAMWSDLIVFLNNYAKAPRTLQSYCSFSVGGTLSVNGHGITTDYCLAESVVRFLLIRADGSIIECSRDSDNEEARDLFRLCIGGYGLFGIIYEVTLKVKDNHRLSMDTVMTPLSDLPHVYEKMVKNQQNQEGIEIKLARIDITTFDVADIYIFCRASDTPTVSNLPAKPKEMSMASKTMYKWFAGPLREVRFAIEHSMGVALDWSEVNDSNSLLFESAKPLAQLYSPWLLIDDTFILQEYFVPKDNFNTWVSDVKDIVLKQMSKETILTLLNVTIRFVHHDTDTAIPYSATSGGSYAFVFYFRIRRTPEGDQLLKSYHKKLANITLQEGGTFYLPYRHHYTRKQLRKAYPGFEQFKLDKKKYDPSGRFTSLWWTHYGCDDVSDHNSKSKDLPSRVFVHPARESCKDSDEVQRLIDNTEIHRSNSFRALMKDPQMRQTFIETFLTEFLSLTNNNALMRIINTAIWDQRLADDNAIYMKLIEQLALNQGPLSGVMSVWNLVKQLAEQKRELVRETVSVLSHIGMVGKVHDLVSIGDHGKLITPLRIALQMRGKTWIVHDDIEADETNIGATLERGTVDKTKLGECIKIDYNHIKKGGREFSEIPDQSVDLVTVNQGLHHLPPKQIIQFLQGVHRILRPGGCFITREHNLDENRHLMPMLDCAHMVFNALTGVQAPSERDEIRGFRSLLDWRKIIESVGFQDSMVYEMQPNDPTVDFMMCFRKLPYEDVNFQDVHRDLTSVTNVISTTESRINAILNQAPHIALNAIKDILKNLRVMLPKIQVGLSAAAKNLIPDSIPGLGNAVELILKSYVNPMLTMLERFEPLAEAAIPKINTAVNIIPDELFLLIDVLRARSKKSTSIVETALVGIIDQIIGLKDEVIAEVKQQETRPSDILSNSLTDSQNLKEIREEFSMILRDIPAFYDIPKVISEIGIPERGSKLILGLLPDEPSIESFTKWVTDKLDTQSWGELKRAFQDIRALKQLPHIDLMKIEGSPWNRAASAILSSKTIQFSATQQKMAGWVGLGDIVQIWSKAQSKNKKSSTSLNNNNNNVELPKPVLDVLDQISPIQVYEGKAKVLTNVMCIVKAEHIHGSITRMLKDVVTDITAEANQVLCLKSGQLDISELRPALQKLTSFRAGENRYIIHYRSIPDASVNSQKFKVNGNKLSNLLSKQGFIDASYHAGRDALNHYKLPEWMQVEMVQVFGQFMDHTPWYRFPFINVLKSYFEVLFKEFGKVSQKTGIMQALSDQGFITDLVPGFVMSLILGQMFLLALPLRKLLGDDYDQTGLYEQLLVLSPYQSKWSKIDSRITNVKSLGHGLFTFHIPTFKPFTEVLLNLARESPLTTILQISNNVSIQVKLECPVKLLKSTLNSIEHFGDDVKVNFNYNLFPKSTNTNDQQHQQPEQISIDVLIQSLIPFIRFIDTLEAVKIVQIYDFY
ncbi:hypothetical protein DLAC_10691 [Tieghemostelium lacteum]|uniref:FAD-binding PCMH-type domain-containing protein n=1 Tax=Tieghemostelium lacteum TaxID=361077 RepID=A0A151Z4I3_TIELA|nr:hypothetical protein DLAC_10691 [Tieghemostelium lacteum]|eukprot:KYQ88882.1 hypothetical protein DLAC_10691 [Tieghemostelium lacteum]